MEIQRYKNKVMGDNLVNKLNRDLLNACMAENCCANELVPIMCSMPAWCLCESP